jgi:hypothetical protein
VENSEIRIFLSLFRLSNICVLSTDKLLDSTHSKQTVRRQEQIKVIEIILPVVISAIIDPVVMLILNLVLLKLDLTWSWSLVCVLALLIGQNSLKSEKETS